MEDEPYFFKKNKYSFARWRTCYGVTVFQTGEVLIPNVTCVRAYYKASRVIWEQEVVFKLNGALSSMMDHLCEAQAIVGEKKLLHTNVLHLLSIQH